MYINGTLCDVTKSFNVRLNRQLLNPAELNDKDAQYSYSIALPQTATNNTAFKYANVEESKNKFNQEYSAELIVGGVQTFKGLFRMSEMSEGRYKGNLYIPAIRSIKDVFGGTKLVDNSPYTIPFGDFADTISMYNTRAATSTQSAIFPYVLYGVLPKVLGNEDVRPDRLVWDDKVRVAVDDMPPSINVMKLLDHLFRSRGYALTGSALTDDRLTGLYMSYKNDPNYKQPWNYGRLGQLRVVGQWANYRAEFPGRPEYPKGGSNSRENLEFRDHVDGGVYEPVPGEEGRRYAIDLFDAQNTIIREVDDPGGNFMCKETKEPLDSDSPGRWLRARISVPASGYYKVEFLANVVFDDQGAVASKGERVVAIAPSDAGFDATRHGLKLLRDRGKGDFGISESKLDGQYYRDNLPQEYNEQNRPLGTYMPVVHGPNGTDGDVVLIDAAQNPNYVLGFQWGKLTDKDVNPSYPVKTCAQVNAAKPMVSWDVRAGYDVTKLAIESMHYRKWDTPIAGSSVPPEWISTAKLGISLREAPRVWARRAIRTAEGAACCVVWLEAGEALTIADVSDHGVGRFAVVDNGLRMEGWMSKDVNLELKLTPFRTDPEWLKLSREGRIIEHMKWTDPSNFPADEIDLIKFLPADMNTDDFIENFCKAFNLRLSQRGEKTFSLDVKQTRKDFSKQHLDLEGFTSLDSRVNTSLGMPSLYKVGFTVDKEEEGFASTDDDGGGTFRTGATETKVLEQKSTFSRTWFKTIKKIELEGEEVPIDLPIISKSEAWNANIDYTESMKKRYTTSALRFWYYDGLLNDDGATFTVAGKPAKIAKVTDVAPDGMRLTYEDTPGTILSNYYTLLVHGSSHYTEVEGYLSPLDYAGLNGNVLARFNGDMYYVAEISGYDPTGQNKTKIKLIRLI